jgi:hypothetical protein
MTQVFDGNEVWSVAGGATADDATFQKLHPLPGEPRP